MNNTNTIINHKPCNYGCGTRSYRDTNTNSYLEVFTKNRYICKNRPANNNMSSPKSNVPKPNYYKFSKQPKPKMNNSLELIADSIDSVQKKYEILSDIVTEYNGKVHGSQSQLMVIIFL
jgi:hypothetical protein